MARSKYTHKAKGTLKGKPAASSNGKLGSTKATKSTAKRAFVKFKNKANKAQNVAKARKMFELMRYRLKGGGVLLENWCFIRGTWGKIVGTNTTAADLGIAQEDFETYTKFYNSPFLQARSSFARNACVPSL